MNRSTIEALSSAGRVIEETSDTYHIALFNGAQMWCPKSDQSLTPCLIRDFYWESWVTSWFLNEIQKHDNFIDIGANCGYYSALATHAGVFTHAFEPNPKYIPMLENIDGVKAYNLALSDEAGRATLYVPGDLEGSATLRGEEIQGYELERLDVEVSTLAKVFSNPHLTGKTLVKVDAEGMEEHILSGATGMEATWLMEYTPRAYSDHFLKDLAERFSLYMVDFNGAERPIVPEDILSYGDWVTLVLRPKR